MTEHLDPSIAVRGVLDIELGKVDLGECQEEHLPALYISAREKEKGGKSGCRQDRNLIYI